MKNLIKLIASEYLYLCGSCGWKFNGKSYSQDQLDMGAITCPLCDMNDIELVEVSK